MYNIVAKLIKMYTGESQYVQKVNAISVDT